MHYDGLLLGLALLENDPTKRREVFRELFAPKAYLIAALMILIVINDIIGIPFH